MKTRSIMRFLFTAVLAIFAMQVSATDYFWVGGSGNWSDHNNHWATTSGGSTFHAQVPTETDDVYFDANSFSSSGQTVTLDADAFCFNMDWSAVTNNPNFSGSREIHIYGSMTLASGMNYNASSDVYFDALTTGHVINTAGQTLAEVWFTGQNTPNGGWTLQSDFTVTGKIDFYSGSFATGANDIDCETFYAWYSTTKNIDFTGADEIKVGREWRLYPNGSATTFNAGTSTIIMDDDNALYYQQINFVGGAFAYHNLVFNRTSDELNQSYKTYGGTLEYNNTFHDVTFNIGGERQFSIYSSNSYHTLTANFVGQNNTLGQPRVSINSGSTIGRLVLESSSDLTGEVYLQNSNMIDTLEMDPGTQLALSSGPVHAFSEIIANGTCDRRITIRSINGAGSPATMSKSSGTVNVAWATIEGVNATGGASFNATNSVGLGANTGWNISSPAASTYYWVGGSGNWNDLSHWSTTSGGTASGCGVPTILDNAVFDANSFSGTGQTVSVNVNAACNSMTWANVTNNPTLAGGQRMTIGGSLTLSPNMNFTQTGEYNFNSESSNTIDLAGHELESAYFSSNSNLNGDWTLLSEFDVKEEWEQHSGEFFSAGYDVSATIFNSNSGQPRTLDFTGTQYINLHETWNLNPYQTTFTIDTATIRLISDPSDQFKGMNFTGGSATYHNVYASHTGLYGYQLYFQGNNTFNNVEIHFNGVQYLRLYGNNTMNDLEIYHEGTSYNTTQLPTVYLHQNNTINRFETFNTSIYKPEIYFYSSNSFGELTPAPGNTLILGSTQTQTVGTLNLVGTCDNGVEVRSTNVSSAGIFNVASGTVNAAYLRIQDNSATGGATFNAIEAIDNGNVTGWNLTSKPATNYYWVGGSGNWSDPAHWSTSSGGAGGTCDIPSFQDNVFFDVNSFPSSGGSVSVDLNAECRSMNWNGAQGNHYLTGGSNGSMSVYGSVIFDNNLSTNGFSGNWHFESAQAGNVLDTKEKYLNNVYFNGSDVSTGEWTLQSNFIVQNSFYHYRGTINSNGYDMGAFYYWGNHSYVKTLNLVGSGTFNARYYWQMPTSTNTTFNVGDYKIYMDYSVYANFNGGNRAYNDLEILLNYNYYNGSPYVSRIYGNNTFNNLIVNVSSPQHVEIYGNNTFNDAQFNFTNNNSAANPEVKLFGSNVFNDFSSSSTGSYGPYFTFNQNNTFSSLTCAGVGTRLFMGATKTQTTTNALALGSGGFPVFLQSTVSGTQANISQASGQVCLDFVWLKDMNATGGASFNAGASSSDLGNNTGWTFSSCAAYYWVGGTGDWSDVNHWATSSGGSVKHLSPPSATDNVFFDGNSFTATGQVVTLDVVSPECKDMSWLSSLYNPTLAGTSASIDIHGSMNMIAAMNVTYTGAFNFKSNNAGMLLNSGGNHLADVNFLGTGEWSLTNVLNVDGTIDLQSGTLLTNDRNVNTTNFVVSTTASKSLDLSTSIVTITDGSWDVQSTSGLTFTPATSLIVLESDNGTADFNGAAMTYNDVTITTPTTMASAMTGLNTFNTLRLEPGITLSLPVGNQTTTNLEATGSCTKYVTVLSSTPGSAGGFYQNSGTVNGNFIDLTDNTASGGATFNANLSVDNGNVSGWNFTSFPALSITTSITDASCNAGNDGTASVNLSGGTPPFVYAWSTTETTNAISGLIPGSYAVTVTDSNGCAAVDSFNISIPAAVSLSAVGTDESCSGAGDGSVALTTTGGTAPFVYSTTATTGLTSGTYTYFVTDSNGCSDTAVVTINGVGSCNSAPTAVCSNINVSAGSNCEAAVAGSQVDGGSTDPDNDVLTYTISPAGPFALGTHTVTLTVTDPEGLSDNCTATITVSDDTDPVVAVQDITIQLDSSGNASIAASQVDNGSTDNCGIGSITVSPSSFDCSNLGQNTVTLTVTDNNGNSAIATASVTVENQAASLSLQTITSPAQVLNQGALIIANNLGAGAEDLQVNGICFDNDYTGLSNFSNGGGDFCADCPSGSLFDRLFNGLVFQPNGSQSSITINGLVPCHNYRLQLLISNDLNSTGNTMEVQVEGTTFNIHNWIPDTKNAIFEFVASGPSTTIVFPANSGSEPDRAIVSAYALHDLDLVGGVTCNTPPVADAGSDQSLFAGNTCNATVTLDGSASTDVDGVNTLTYEWISNGSSVGNAATVTVTQGLGDEDYILVVTDDWGHESRDTMNVLVEDNTPPSASANDLTVQLDSNGQAFINTFQIDNGSADNCSIDSMYLDVNGFDCTDTGDNIVTLTVVDGSGNSSFATATVTVQDVTAPLVSANDLTIYVDNSGNATITAAQVNNGSTDNCGIGSLSVSPSSFDCSNIGNNSVTLTVTDVNGNSAMASATVTVEDTEFPTVATQDVTVYLDNSGSASITAAQIDNGSSDNCGIDSMYLSNNTFGCVTNNALDFDGVTDYVAVPHSPDFNITDEITVEAWINTRDASKNQKIVGKCKNGTARNGFGLGIGYGSVYGEFYTATNGSAVGSSGITSNTWIHLAMTWKTNGQKRIYINGVLANSSAAGSNDLGIDVNDLHIGIAPYNTTEYRFDGQIDEVRIWDVERSASEIAGAMNACLSGSETGLVAYYQFDQVGSSVLLDKHANGNDGNLINMDPSTDWVEGTPSVSCSANEVTLTVIDNSGNQSSATALVTVQDTILPTVIAQDITVELDSNGQASITVAQIDNGSFDNCSIDQLTLDQLDFDCNDAGNNTVTLTGVDPSGNTASATATVTVEDNSLPTAIANDLTVYLNNAGTASITLAQVNNGSSDNCGIDSIYLSNYNFDCTDVGVNNVTLTVIDANGNSNSAAANITVVDTLVPNAIAQNITVQLDNSGNASITAAQIDNGSTDNCGINSLSVSPSTFDCSDAGTSSGLALDGSNDYATVNRTSLGLNGHTVQAWIKTTATDAGSSYAGNPAMTVVGDHDNNVGMTFGVDGGKVEYNHFNGTWNSLTSVSSVNDGQWHNISVSHTSTGTVTIYIDGVADNSGSIALSTNPTYTSFDVIGASYLSSTNYQDFFNGTIDEVRLWNTALSATSLSATYGSPLTGAESGLVAYYDFEEGSGTTLNDGSPSNLNAAVQSGSWTTGAPVYQGHSVVLTVTDFAGNIATGNATVTVVDEILPTVITQDITVSLDSNGQASITVAQIDSGSFDNCSIDLLTISQTDFDCSNAGANTVTLTAVDASGNTASATATVTVEDNEAPAAIAQDLTVYLDMAGSAMITTAQIDNGSNDNCAIDTLFLDDYAFDCSDIGANTVTLTAIDVNGNTSNATATVTVVDSISTAVMAQDITVQLDSNGMASITVGDINNGSADACGLDTLYLDVYDFDCSNIGANTVTLTVIDNNGNLATAMATVTVEDTIAPVVTSCPANITTTNLPGSCFQNTSFSIPTFSDACSVASVTQSNDGNVFIYHVGGGNYVGSFAVGTTTVTYTATDNNGNSSTCSFTVTVEDNEAPYLYGCPDSITVTNAPGACSQTVNWTPPTTSDNCPNWMLYTTHNPGTVFPVGTTVVTYDVMDPAGNSASCSFNVNVLDVELPVVACQNVTVQLDANGMGSTTAAAVDNGSTDNCGIATLDLSQTDFDCSHVGTNSVTLTVTDVHGNVNTCTATVTVEDNIAPVALAQNVTIQLDSAGMASVTAIQVNDSSSDACGIATMTLSQTNFNCTETGSNSVTLTVTDVNGNVSTATADVTVEDNIAPTVLTQGVTVALDANGQASITTLDIDNGSADNCSISTLALDVTDFDCSNVGTNTVTLTATDASGNMVSAMATVTVEDNILPTVLTQDITLYLDANGDASTTASAINNASFDNCGIDTMTLDVSDFDCSNVGANTVMLTVIDVNGNMNTATATVSIIDTMAPVAITQNVTVALDANGQASITAQDVNNGSNDACGIDSMYVSVTSFDCTNVGTNTVTLTVVDANGNSSSADATITVEDNMPATVAVQDITIQLDSAGQASIDVNDIDNGSSDNCGIASMVLSATDFDCSNTGLNVVTLTVTDVNGNVSNANASVEVEDVIAPTAIAANIYLSLDANGQASITAAQIDNGSTDECGIANVSVSQTDFDCSHVGTNSVTLTVEDNNGNLATATSTVTIADNSAPTVVCTPVTINLNSNGVAQVTAAMVDGGTTDNCGIESLVLSETLFNCAQIGTQQVTLTATDVNGNESSCVTSVTVVDTTLNVTLTCSDDITVSCENSLAPVSWTAPSAQAFSEICGVSCEAGNELDGFIYLGEFQGHHYYCSSTSDFSWTEANALAQSNGGNLVSINTPAENNFVKNAIQAQYVWIGYNDMQTEGNWMWSDGSASGYQSWSPGEPNNQGSSWCWWANNANHAVLKHNNGKWYDRSNFESYEFVMELECNSSNLSVNQIAGPASGTVFPVGVTPVTYVAYDSTSGLSDTCTFSVTVEEDTEAPSAVCQNVTLTLVNGLATINPQDLDGGSTDNCSGIASIAISQSQFDSTDVGENEVTLTVTDGAGNTATCEAVVTIEAPAPQNVYCTTGGNSYYEWIENIQVNGQSNASGNDGGYGDYTNQTIALPIGGTSPVSLTPGYSGSAYVEHWRIWIDLNNDGDFDDGGEKVFQKKGKYTRNGNLHVPGYAQAGTVTTMRIAMSWNGWPSPCGACGYGEVEDYTVVLSGGSTKSATAYTEVEAETMEDDRSVMLFPNPNNGQFNLRFNGAFEGKVTLEVWTMDGKLIETIQQGEVSNSDVIGIDISGSGAGMYFLKINQAGYSETIRFNLL